MTSSNIIEIEKSAHCKHTPRIMGSGNTLLVGKNAKIHAFIEIIGDGNIVTIEDDCIIQGRINIKTTGAVFCVGRKTTWMNVAASMHEPGKITIGEDCMFSGDVYMDVSDNHTIFDLETGERLNPPADISIGHHVWLGRSVHVQKGCQIGNGSIVGARSVARGSIPPRTLSVGVPSKVVRKNVSWVRPRLNAISAEELEHWQDVLD